MSLSSRSALFGLLVPVSLALAAACGSTDATPTTGDDDAGLYQGPGPGPGPGSDSGSSGGQNGKIKTVFLIMMENHSWSTIKSSASAAYINGTLIPMGAHTEKYSTPAGNHPSEPNYIWLEAGDNLGVTNDNAPATNHKATKDHLSTQLETAGITWKAYAEGITAGTCPLTSSGLYDPKHTPQLFFDDVTDTNTAGSQHCIDHVRPYSELASDLTMNKAARYNFITPNLCNDMHGETFGTSCNTFTSDLIKKGDEWLAAQVPTILASQAFKDDGLLIVLWDEGDESIGNASDGPIPALFISANAKKGFASMTPYTHSSMLRTIETIFGVPYLGGAKTATDLSEMFTSFP
jgi:hypothetical protein